MASQLATDLAMINDEDQLRCMWQQTEDFARKKEIRAHMYRLREARLRDFYTGEMDTTNIGITKTPLTASHGDSLADQSFQSFKTKEIRDSESPTRDYKYGIIAPDTSGWNVVTSAETTNDGKTHTTHSLATTGGTQEIPGGKTSFSGKNEQLSSITHEGDDQNYKTSAGQSSNTVVKETSIVGDDKSGRTENKTSTVSSSSNMTTTRHTSSGDRAFADHKNIINEFDDMLTSSSKHIKTNVVNQQNVAVDKSTTKSSTEQNEQRYIYDESNNDRFDTTNRDTANTNTNINERSTLTTTSRDMDGRTRQQEAERLAALPGIVTSRRVEYPDANTKMITETKTLADGTTVTTTKYETKSASSKIWSTASNKQQSSSSRVITEDRANRSKVEYIKGDTKDVIREEYDTRRIIDANDDKLRNQNVPQIDRRTSNQDVYQQVDSRNIVNKQNINEKTTKSDVYQQTSHHEDVRRDVHVDNKSNKSTYDQHIREEYVSRPDSQQPRQQEDISTERTTRTHVTETFDRQHPRDDEPRRQQPVTRPGDDEPRYHQPHQQPRGDGRPSARPSAEPSPHEIRTERTTRTDVTETYDRHYPKDGEPRQQPREDSSRPTTRPRDEPHQQQYRPHNDYKAERTIRTDVTETYDRQYPTDNEPRRQQLRDDSSPSTRPAGQPQQRQPDDIQTNKTTRTDMYSEDTHKTVKKDLCQTTRDKNITNTEIRRSYAPSEVSQFSPTSNRTFDIPEPEDTAIRYETSQVKKDTVKKTNRQEYTSKRISVEVDAAHEAFAKSLRCVSPDRGSNRSVRTSTTSIRSATSPDKNRSRRSPSRESATYSESSRISSNTVTRSKTDVTSDTHRRPVIGSPDKRAPQTKGYSPEKKQPQKEVPTGRKPSDGRLTTPTITETTEIIITDINRRTPSAKHPSPNKDRQPLKETSPIRRPTQPQDRQETPEKQDTSSARRPSQPQQGRHVPEKYETSPTRRPSQPQEGRHVPEKSETSPTRRPSQPQQGRHVPEKYETSPTRRPSQPQQGRHVPEKSETSPTRHTSQPQTPQKTKPTSHSVSTTKKPSSDISSPTRKHPSMSPERPKTKSPEKYSPTSETTTKHSTVTKNVTREDQRTTSTKKYDEDRVTRRPADKSPTPKPSDKFTKPTTDRDFETDSHRSTSPTSTVSDIEFLRSIPADQITDLDLNVTITRQKVETVNVEGIYDEEPSTARDTEEFIEFEKDTQKTDTFTRKKDKKTTDETTEKTQRTGYSPGKTPRDDGTPKRRPSPGKNVDKVRQTKEFIDIESETTNVREDVHRTWREDSPSEKQPTRKPSQDKSSPKKPTDEKPDDTTQRRQDIRTETTTKTDVTETYDKHSRPVSHPGEPKEKKPKDDLLRPTPTTRSDDEPRRGISPDKKVDKFKQTKEFIDIESETTNVREDVHRTWREDSPSDKHPMRKPSDDKGEPKKPTDRKPDDTTQRRQDIRTETTIKTDVTETYDKQYPIRDDEPIDKHSRPASHPGEPKDDSLRPTPTTRSDDEPRRGTSPDKKVDKFKQTKEFIDIESETTNVREDVHRTWREDSPSDKHPMRKPSDDKGEPKKPTDRKPDGTTQRRQDIRTETTFETEVTESYDKRYPRENETVDEYPQQPSTRPADSPRKSQPRDSDVTRPSTRSTDQPKQQKPRKSSIKKAPKEYPQEIIDSEEETDEEDVTFESEITHEQSEFTDNVRRTETVETESKRVIKEKSPTPQPRKSSLKKPSPEKTVTRHEYIESRDEVDVESYEKSSPVKPKTGDKPRNDVPEEHPESVDEDEEPLVKGGKPKQRPPLKRSETYEERCMKILGMTDQTVINAKAEENFTNILSVVDGKKLKDDTRDTIDFITTEKITESKTRKTSSDTATTVRGPDRKPSVGKPSQANDRSPTRSPDRKTAPMKKQTSFDTSPERTPKDVVMKKQPSFDGTSPSRPIVRSAMDSSPDKSPATSPTRKPSQTKPAHESPRERDVSPTIKETRKTPTSHQQEPQRKPSSHEVPTKRPSTKEPITRRQPSDVSPGRVSKTTVTRETSEDLQQKRVTSTRKIQEITTKETDIVDRRKTTEKEDRVTKTTTTTDKRQPMPNGTKPVKPSERSPERRPITNGVHKLSPEEKKVPKDDKKQPITNGTVPRGHQPEMKQPRSKPIDQSPERRHITTAKIIISPITSKTTTTRPTTKTTTTHKTQTDKVSKTKKTSKIISGSHSDYSSEPETEKDSGDEITTILEKTSTTTRRINKMPVTERKESAPVYRTTRNEKDTVHKMARSTSDNVIKTTSARKRSKPEMEPIKQMEKPKMTRPDSKRPTKCVTTKTINLSAKNQDIRSEDIDIIIDIQQAKSSREPTPNRIVPTPVSPEEDTGKPRYPDTVHEPDDEAAKRRPKIKNIPIFEEETNDYVGCSITEMHDEEFYGTESDECLLSVTEKVNKFTSAIDRKSPPKDKKPKVTRPLMEIDEELKTDECLLSVSDKVSKFITTAEEIKKPRTSAPFKPSTRPVSEVTETDECLLSVTDKVNKFITTAEEIKKPKTSTPFRPDSHQPDEPTESDDFLLSVNDKVTKFLTTAEKVMTTTSTTTQKVDESVTRIKRPQYEDVDENLKEDECLLSVSDKVTKFKTTAEKLTTPQRSPELVAKIERQVSRKDKPGDDSAPEEPSERRTTDKSVPKQNVADRYAPKEKPTPTTTSPPSTLRSTEAIKKAKAVFESNQTTTTSTTKKDSTSRQRDILSRPSVWEGKRTTPRHDVKLTDIGVINRTPERELEPSPDDSKHERGFYLSKPHERETPKVLDRAFVRPTTDTPTTKTTPDTIPSYMKDTVSSRKDLFEKRISSSRLETVDVETITKSPTPSKQKPQKRVPSSTTKTTSDEVTSSRITQSSQRQPTHYDVDSDTENDEHRFRTTTSTTTTTYQVKGQPRESTSTTSPSHPKQIPKDTITAKRNLFEHRERSPSVESSMDRNKPSYMSHTVSSLEHINSSRKDSIEITKSQQIRKTSVDDRDYETPVDGTAKGTVKFGVELKRTNSQTTPRRKSSSAEVPHIEDIFDLELLENMLETVVGYEQRRRIRSQIRIVKRHLETSTKTTSSSSTFTTSSSQQKRETIQNRSTETSPTRPSSKHPIPKSSPSGKLLNAPRTSSPPRKPVACEYRTTDEFIETGRATSRTERQSTRSPSPKSKMQPAKMRDVEIITVEKPQFGDVRKQPLKITKDTQPKEGDKPIWATKNILKKSSDTNRAFSTKKSVTDNKTQRHKIVETVTESRPTDSITSSYGIGPTDDDGRPIFGIRALKKKQPQETSTTKVSGSIIQESYYSENGATPVGERTVTVYSNDPEDLQKFGVKPDKRSPAQIRDHLFEKENSRKNIVSVTKTQKLGGRSGATPAAIMDSTGTSSPSAKVVRRGSVKELSEKFIQKEASTTEKTSIYPKAGLILRSQDRQKSRSTTPGASSFRSESVDYESDEEIRSETYHQRHDGQTIFSQRQTITTGSDDDTDGYHRKTTTKETRSFLNNGNKVTGVQDVLDRMRNADNVEEDGDTVEDKEARALLNKFLGASVLMTGMESMMPQEMTRIVGTPSSRQQQQQQVTRVTKTIKSSTPVAKKTCGIEDIWDEGYLKQLLEQTTNYEERSKIRARIRQIMAEKEACADIVASVTAELQQEKSNKDTETEKIYEKVDNANKNIVETTTASAAPAAAAVAAAAGAVAVPQGESLLLPLLQGLLSKNSPQRSYSNQSTNEECAVHVEDSGTESGEDLKLLAAGLHDTIEMHRNEQSQLHPNKNDELSSEGVEIGLLNEVTTALERLETSLREGKNINFDQDKRKALLNLVSRLQIGLLSPDKITALTPAPGVLINDPSSPDAEARLDLGRRASSGQGRFARRRNRQNRHTVGVSREELADARRIMEDMIIRENISNSVTPDSLSTPPEQAYNLPKPESASTLLSHEPSAVLFRPNQFIPKDTKENPSTIQTPSPELSMHSAPVVHMRERKPKYKFVRQSLSLDQSSSFMKQTAIAETDFPDPTIEIKDITYNKRPLGESISLDLSQKQEEISARKSIQDAVQRAAKNKKTEKVEQTPDDGSSDDEQFVHPTSRLVLGKTEKVDNRVAEKNFYNKIYHSNMAKGSKDFVEKEKKNQENKKIFNKPASGFRRSKTPPGKSMEDNMMPIDNSMVSEDNRSSNKFNVKKLKMKRANTIDIPKPYLNDQESDDFGSEDEMQQRKKSLENTMGLRTAIHVGNKTVNKDKVVPTFEPKTENDHKFLAFIQKQSTNNSLSWNNPGKQETKPLQNNWSNAFGNKIKAFENPTRPAIGVKSSGINNNSARSFWKTAETATVTLAAPILKSNKPKLPPWSSEKPKTTDVLESANIVTGSLRIKDSGGTQPIQEKTQVVIPKPIPVNKFSHAPLSAFKPLSKKIIQPIPQFKPIQPEPIKSVISIPPTSTNVKQLSNGFIEPLPPVNSLKPKPLPPMMQTSPTKNIANNFQLNQNQTTNKSPTFLPWASAKPSAETRVLNIAASKFENPSLPPAGGSGKISPRSNSMKIKDSGLGLFSSPTNYTRLYDKRPSLPTNSYSYSNDLNAPHLVQTYQNTQNETISKYSLPPPQYKSEPSSPRKPKSQPLQIYNDLQGNVLSSVSLPSYSESMQAARKPKSQLLPIYNDTRGYEISSSLSSQPIYTEAPMAPILKPKSQQPSAILSQSEPIYPEIPSRQIYPELPALPKKKPKSKPLPIRSQPSPPPPQLPIYPEIPSQQYYPEMPPVPTYKPKPLPPSSQIYPEIPPSKPMSSDVASKPIKKPKSQPLPVYHDTQSAEKAPLPNYTVTDYTPPGCVSTYIPTWTVSNPSDDSITNPNAEPLILTCDRPIISPNPRQESLKIFDYSSPESISPSKSIEMQDEWVDEPITKDSTEYKAVSARVMTGPVSHSAVTVSHKTNRIGDEDSHGKGSLAAKSLHSVLKGIKKTSPPDTPKFVPSSPTSQPSQQSQKLQSQNIAPRNDNMFAQYPVPAVPPKSAIKNNPIIIKQQDYSPIITSPPSPVLKHPLTNPNVYSRPTAAIPKYVVPHIVETPSSPMAMAKSEIPSHVIYNNTVSHPPRSTGYSSRSYASESIEVADDGQSVLTTKFQIPVRSSYQGNEYMSPPLASYQPPPTAVQQQSSYRPPVMNQQQTRSPIPLSKSDSWHQICQSSNKPPSPKSFGETRGLQRAKSQHMLSVPKQFEAGIAKEKMNEKQRTVAAYFSGKRSPQPLTKTSSQTNIPDRLNNAADQQATFSTSSSSSSGATSKSKKITTTKETKTDDDGAVVTTTTKVTTRTIQTKPAPKPMSPFAKFRQLDKQNSAQSPPNSPLTPKTPGGPSAPLFKFTDPALSARAATVKEQLLQWCQIKTKEYENVQITNFSTSWTDGLAFCALIHHFLPDAFDYSALTPQQRKHNFTLAFRVADEKAGIAPLLDVEDMVVMRKPDWKCVFTYVQSIYRRFKNAD